MPRPPSAADLLTAADLLPLRAPPTLPAGTLPAQAQAALEGWHVQVLAQAEDGLSERLNVWLLTATGAALRGCPARPLAWACAQLRSQTLEPELSGLLALEPLAMLEPLAIVEEGSVLGLLTRQDVEGDKARGAALWERLSEAHQQLLAELLSVQRELGRGSVALVGGAVRDLLLGVAGAITDLDCVVVGQDVFRLARALHERCGGVLSLHPEYGNATLSLPHGPSLDLIAARMERYPHPGQAPQVWAGTLAQDLARRDFGLNALALRLNDLALCAPAGALAELRERTLRPLHPHSLQEDPSRLVRAARLAARLGLRAHPELLRQVPQALALAGQTPRLWAEMRLMLAEARPARALECLLEWGAGALVPCPERVLEVWRALELLEGQSKGLAEELSPALRADLYAAALLGAALPTDYALLLKRLSLGKRPERLLERVATAGLQAGLVQAKFTSAEKLLTCALYPAHTEPALPLYTPLTGRDLLAMGYSAGPGVGRALSQLHAGRIEGQVHSREDEVALALDMLRQP